MFYGEDASKSVYKHQYIIMYMVYGEDLFKVYLFIIIISLSLLHFTAGYFTKHRRHIENKRGIYPAVNNTGGLR